MQTIILLALVIVIGWVLFRPFTQKELDRFNDKDWPDIKVGLERWLSPDNFDAQGQQLNQLENEKIASCTQVMNNG